MEPKHLVERPSPQAQYDSDHDHDQEDGTCNVRLAEFVLGCCSAAHVEDGFGPGPPVPCTVPSGFRSGSFAEFREGFLPFVQEAARSEASSGFENALTGKRAKKEGTPDDLADLVVRARLKVSAGEEYVLIKEVDYFGAETLSSHWTLGGGDVVILLPEPPFHGAPPFPLDLSRGGLLLGMSGRRRGIPPAELNSPLYNGNEVVEMLRSTSRTTRYVELRAIRAAKLFLRHVIYDSLQHGGSRLCAPIENAFAGRAPISNEQMPESQALRQACDHAADGQSLHESQLRIVEAASALKRGVLVVWGPPGTGKTKTLVPVIYSQYWLHCRGTEAAASQTRAQEESVKPQVGCFAPTNRAIRELCQRFVDTHGAAVGFAKVLLFRSLKAELGETKQDVELLLPVDMHARQQRIRAWFSSPALDRVGLVLGNPCAFLNETQRELEKELERVESGLTSPSDKDLAALQGDLQLFQEGKLFEILHRELETSLEKLRMQTRDIERDVSGASRDPTMRMIASAQLQLAGVLKNQELDSVLAALKRVAWERHFLSSVEGGRLLQERAEEVISSVGEASASIKMLHSTAEQRRAIARMATQRVPFDKLQSAIISEAAIVFSTTMMAPLMPMHRERLNCVSVLIDEAGQVPEANLAAIVDTTWQRLILAGDDKQLPAVVNGEGCEAAGFGRSLLERLRTDPDMQEIVLMLDMQFRMDPIIAKFSSQEFYDDRLRSWDQTENPLPKTAEGSVPNAADRFLGGIVICDTSGMPTSPEQVLDFSDRYPKHGDGSPLLGVEYKPAGSPSYANDMEACLIQRSLEKFEKTTAGTREWSVGVIAPYASQVALLNTTLSKWIRPDPARKLRVLVGTVDSFQGSEADIIILSTVRSNRMGNIGFVASGRRLNVAFTRARFGLWIFCNVRTLAKRQGTVWARFLGKFVAENPIHVVKCADDFAKRKAGKCTTPEQDARAYFMRDSLLKKSDSTSAFQAGTANLKVLAKGLSVDDIVDGTGSWAWMVASEERVDRQMQSMRRDLRLPVAYCISQIATGKHFTQPRADAGYSEDITKDFPNFAIDVFQLQFTNPPFSLLWYVRLNPNDLRQMIVIAEVVKSKDIREKQAALASRLMSGQSREYLQACCVFERPVGGACVPKQFPRDHTAFRVVEGGAVCARAEVDVSRELRKLHIVTGREWLTQLLLQLRKSGPEVELPLLMSVEQEQLKTTLVTDLGILAGRGGSGKTEVLLNVGLAVVLTLRKTSSFDEDTDPSFVRRAEQRLIPALLVTQSSVLAKTLKKRTANMLRVAECTPPDEFESWPPEEKRAFLQEIMESGSSSGHSDAVDPEDFQVGTQTQDMLTLTVRQTLHALDNTLMGKRFFGSSADLQSHGHDFKRGEVTFARFRDRIWPKIQNKSGRFRFSAISVFKEIMDIKARNEGSSPAELVLRTLSKEEYVGSEQRSKTFEDQSERESMYRLYLEYEKEKGKEDWDICDLCMDLWKRFTAHGYARGQTVAKLLSDESQDLHRCEILALSILVANEDACVFAYDMAQTIAEGRKFDVKTVKDLIFARFRTEHAVRRTGDRMQYLTRKLRAQYLRMNFRTHVGVLEPVALFCVDTMKQFFRDQIDGELPRESSLETGPPPTLVCDVSDADFREALFPDNAPAEYGAKHAIIVFDPEEKQQVAAFLSVREEDLDRVFTPAEAKGLQFESVLVWKCFANRVSDHPCWPLMYQMLQDALQRPRGPDSRANTSSYSPTLVMDERAEWERLKQRVESACRVRVKVSDGDRDKWVRELKMLYVIMTRSQNALILYEGGCRPADAAVHGSQMQLVRDFLDVAPRHGLLGRDGEIISGPEVRESRKPLLQVADTVEKLGLDKAVQAFGTVSNAAELEAEAANYFTQEVFDQASKMFKKAGATGPATVSDVRRLWAQAESEIKDAPTNASRNAARAAEMLNQFGDRCEVLRMPVLEEFREHRAMKAKTADLQESFVVVARCFEFVGRWEEAAFVLEQFVESKTHHRDAAELYERAAGACDAEWKKRLTQRAAEQFEKHGAQQPDALWASKCTDLLLHTADCAPATDSSRFAPLLEFIARHRERLPDEVKLQALRRVASNLKVNTPRVAEARKQRAESEAAARSKLAECESRIELAKKGAVAEPRGADDVHGGGAGSVVDSRQLSAPAAGSINKKKKKTKSKPKPKPSQQVSASKVVAVDPARLMKQLEEERSRLEKAVEESRDTPAWQRKLLLCTAQAHQLLDCAFLLTAESTAKDFLAEHDAAALTLVYWDRRVAELRSRPADERDMLEELRVLQMAADTAELQGDWLSALRWHEEAGGSSYHGFRVSRANADRASVFKRCKTLMGGDKRSGVPHAIETNCPLRPKLDPKGDFKCDQWVGFEQLRADFHGISMAGYVQACVAAGYEPPTASAEAIEQWYEARAVWLKFLLDGQKAFDAFPAWREIWVDSESGMPDGSSFYCLTDLIKATAVCSPNAEVSPVVLSHFGARKIRDGGEPKIVSCYHLSSSTDEPLVQSVPEFRFSAHAHYQLLRGMLLSSLAHALLFRVARSGVFAKGSRADVDSQVLCKEAAAVEAMLSTSTPHASVQREIESLIDGNSLDVDAPLATLREVLAAAAFDLRGSVASEDFLAMLDRELDGAGSEADVATAQFLELVAFQEACQDVSSASAARIRKRADKCANVGLCSAFERVQTAGAQLEGTLAEQQRKLQITPDGVAQKLDPSPEHQSNFDAVVQILDKHAAFAETLQKFLLDAVASVVIAVNSDKPSRRSVRAAQHYARRATILSVFPDLSGQARVSSGKGDDGVQVPVQGHRALELKSLELEHVVLLLLSAGQPIFDSDAMERHRARELQLQSELSAAQGCYDSAVALRNTQLAMLEQFESTVSSAERAALRELPDQIKRAEKAHAAEAAEAAKATKEVADDAAFVAGEEDGLKGKPRKQHTNKWKAVSATATNPAAVLAAIMIPTQSEKCAKQGEDDLARLHTGLKQAEATMAEARAAWASRAREVWEAQAGGDVGCVDELELQRLAVDPRLRVHFRKERIPRGQVSKLQKDVEAAKLRLKASRQALEDARSAVEKLRARFATCSGNVKASCQKLSRVVCKLEEADAQRQQVPQTLRSSDLGALRAGVCAAVGFAT